MTPNYIKTWVTFKSLLLNSKRKLEALLPESHSHLRKTSSSYDTCPNLDLFSLEVLDVTAGIRNMFSPKKRPIKDQSEIQGQATGDLFK